MSFNKKTICITALVVFFSAALFAANLNPDGETIFTPIREVLSSPEDFRTGFVSLRASFRRWHTVTGHLQSWVAHDTDGSSIVVKGKLPPDLQPGHLPSLTDTLTILGIVRFESDRTPYIRAIEVIRTSDRFERLVSVAQIIFDPITMQGRQVGLHGVLAKGFGFKGNRMYLLADPTGAITLGRLPRLYPTGTILRVRGVVAKDSDGIPMIDDVEIIDAELSR